MEFKCLMTFDEMAQHFSENSPFPANYKSVGTYAKKNGFVRKQLRINGVQTWRYYNESLFKKGESK